MDGPKIYIYVKSKVFSMSEQDPLKIVASAIWVWINAYIYSGGPTDLSAVSVTSGLEQNKAMFRAKFVTWLRKSE